MRIIRISESPNVNNFKNKEEFCNKLIQEVINITKNNSISTKASNKIKDIEQYLNTLKEKDKKLNELLDKSYKMKNELNEKIKFLDEDNNKYKEKLLNILTL